MDAADSKNKTNDELKNSDDCIKIDFHIHSCHSACGSLDMSPKNVIKSLLNQNIKIAAISDHNSIKNSFSFISLGIINGICIFPACEIQTEEEIHLVVVFPNLEIAQKWQNWIDQIIPKIELNPEIFGDEPIVDEDENILELPEILYSVSLPISFDDLEKKATQDNLLYFPAHIGDSSYSLISQLGFIPEDHLFHIAEVSNKKDFDVFKINNPDLTLITNSDAHYLNQIGLRYNCIYSDHLKIAFGEFLASIKKVFNEEVKNIDNKYNQNIISDKNKLIKIEKKIEDIRIRIYFIIKDILNSDQNNDNKFVIKTIFNK